MLVNNEAKTYQLFRELSAKEQECLAAGLNSDFFAKSDFFFQHTNIQTEAENKVKVGDESNIQLTKYNLSQITLGTSVTFRWTTFNFNVDAWNNWMNNLFKRPSL